MQASAKDRRSFFRVDDQALLVYRIVSKDEMEAGIRQLEVGGFAPDGLASSYTALEARLIGLLESLKESAPGIAECLELLNIKVNSVLELSSIVEDSNDNILEQLPRDCNLSASGIAFVNQEALKADSIIFLRMVMPPNYAYVNAYARVVRSEPLPEPQGNYQYMIAAEYIFLLDRHRELLIKKIMSKESLALRLRRASADDESLSN